MKLWVDDIRPAPDNTYIVCRSVNEAKRLIEDAEVQSSIPRMFDCNFCFSVIDIDHDAGDYAKDGGDYIKLLDWLEETGRNYPIHIHSMNPVGVQNMRRIIERNGWKEV
jgi:hypothetical protein